jgi:hypothetical protein
MSSKGTIGRFVGRMDCRYKPATGSASLNSLQHIVLTHIPEGAAVAGDADIDMVG